MSELLTIHQISDRLDVPLRRLLLILKEGALPQPTETVPHRRWKWSDILESEFMTHPEEFNRADQIIDGPQRVYFLGMNELIKIGYSASLKKRINQLADAIPYEISLLHDIPGDQELEAYYHYRFRAQRFRGEWFHRHDDILKHIEELKERSVTHGIGFGLKRQFSKFVTPWKHSNARYSATSGNSEVLRPKYVHKSLKTPLNRREAALLRRELRAAERRKAARTHFWEYCRRAAAAAATSA